MLGMLLAALDQTIVATAEPQTIAHLSGFDRYPWVSTAYLLSSTISVPIFAKLSRPRYENHGALSVGRRIRSGTFALGVIQSLAGRGMLEQFDYLSTVSGGGYIGGWLTAWIHRHPNGLLGVIADLGGRQCSKVEHEPEPLRHLRDYSSFITPRTGLLSADTWTFVVIYIRNLLLNWVVLVPLLASVGRYPRASVAVLLAKLSWGFWRDCCCSAGSASYC